METVLSVFRYAVYFAVFAVSAIGCGAAGYYLTGQGSMIVVKEEANHAKAERVGVILIVALLAGVFFVGMTKIG